MTGSGFCENLATQGKKRHAKRGTGRTQESVQCIPPDTPSFSNGRNQRLDIRFSSPPGAGRPAEPILQPPGCRRNTVIASTPNTPVERPLHRCQPTTQIFANVFPVAGQAVLTLGKTHSILLSQIRTPLKHHLPDTMPHGNGRKKVVLRHQFRKVRQCIKFSIVGTMPGNEIAQLLLEPHQPVELVLHFPHKLKVVIELALVELPLAQLTQTLIDPELSLERELRGSFPRTEDKLFVSQEQIVADQLAVKVDGDEGVRTAPALLKRLEAAPRKPQDPGPAPNAHAWQRL